jgi:uncharacterized protein YutD
MTPQRTQDLSQFREQYARFTSFNLDFYYKDKAGDLSLRNQLQPIFQNFTDKFSKANEIIDQLPDEKVNQLFMLLLNINNYLPQISSYSLDEYIKNRFEIVEALEKRQNELLNIWEGIAGVYAESKLRLTGFVGEGINLLKEKAQKDAQLIDEYTTRLSDQIRDFEERYKPAAAKGEFLVQGSKFLETADFNNNESYKWLWISLILLGILLGICIWFLFSCWIDFSCLRSDLNTQKNNLNWLIIFEVIRKSFIRLLIISIIIYLLKFSIKNYNALKHNFVINRHKANSLDASMHLMNNLPAGVGRDEVINTASKEIFTQHKTGYLLKDQEMIDITVLEKLLSLIKAKGKE